MQVFGFDDGGGFLGNFSHRTFEGRFAGGHFKLPADGAPAANVRGFGALNE
jgi:hypothetical protein